MLTHAVAGLSGFLMKIYDDVVDNPEAYSNVFTNKLVLEIVMIACVTYFAYLDPVALIACMFTVMVDIILYTYNLYYPALNVNYAIDKGSWGIGILLMFALLIYKGVAVFESFVTFDYLIIMAGFGIIFLDAISLISTNKEIITDPYANMVHLEASDRKLFIRIIALCGSIAGALFIQFIPLFYEYFHILTYIFTWGISYFSTSVLSILYLQHQYKQKNIVDAAILRLSPKKIMGNHDE